MWVSKEGASTSALCRKKRSLVWKQPYSKVIEEELNGCPFAKGSKWDPCSTSSQNTSMCELREYNLHMGWDIYGIFTFSIDKAQDIIIVPWHRELSESERQTAPCLSKYLTINIEVLYRSVLGISGVWGVWLALMLSRDLRFESLTMICTVLFKDDV